MMQPEGFKEGNELRCKLHKSLYGLKQAGRRWNACFTHFLEKFELVPLKTDHCVYKNMAYDLDDKSKESVLIALYVDDGLIMSNSNALIEKVIGHLRGAFEETVGDATSYVSLQIIFGNDRINLKREQYIKRRAHLIRMDEPAQVTTPLNPSVKYCRLRVVGGEAEEDSPAPYRQIIGTLMYLSNSTRPDLVHAMCSLSRFNEHPKASHWEAGKRVTRYAITTQDRCLKHVKNRDGLKLTCYSDADYGDDRDDRKSISSGMEERKTK